MQKYIGTKLIHAEPAPAPKQIGEIAEGADGYKVVYDDGYESWSPRDVFESAYVAIVDAPEVDLLRFFTFEHLPPKLKQISMPFARLANQLVSSLPHCPERTAGLRKLLEAKDCAVRAAL